MQLFELKRVFYALLDEQKTLRVVAKAAGDEFRREHDRLDVKLNFANEQIDQYIRCERFIEFCNTPCWRYRC